ncbi:MAG: hypothetical protein E6H68_11810 [Betaproteobacteria bacterium]|nr:MAG: hypothetical protein E6H68_11810 [Betaproteobacteria bacterium]
MKDKTVAILESRAGDRVASLIRKYGGEPFLAPALSEVPDVDPERIRALIGDWESAAPEIFIFQTGVGTRALFAATDSMGLTPALLRVLEGSIVVVRGPKPTAALGRAQGAYRSFRGRSFHHPRGACPVAGDRLEGGPVARKTRGRATLRRDQP